MGKQPPRVLTVPSGDDPVGEAAKRLTNDPTDQLRAAIEQLSIWIARVEVDPAPKRLDTRERLHEVADSADRLAQTIERGAAAAGLSAEALVRLILAQRVARYETYINARDLRELAAGAREMAKRIPTGPGRKSVASTFEWPSGRTFCALAAVELFRAAAGRVPGSSDIGLLELCAILWRLAGCSETISDVDSWQRHLKRVLYARIKGPDIQDSREIIHGVLAQLNLIARTPDRPPGKFVGE